MGSARPLALTALLAAAIGWQAPAAAADMPLVDAHIHYSHDAWDVVPVERAVALLRQAGVTRALVSSSNDEGTQRLLAAAPDLVVPSLRPYRARGETGSWVRDASVIPYLEERLGRHRYVAIGEFHVHGTDADLPVVRQVVALAHRHGLFLHAHADADAVERLFAHDPQARILWAHAGFEAPDRVRDMMRRHPALWADLSFRGEVAAGGRVSPEWRSLLLAFPDRFMVGTDTYTPERWSHVVEHAAWARAWLADLPPEVAAGIAHGNAEALIAGSGDRPAQ